MAEAMKGATRAMGTMNRSMNLPQIQRIMRDFEKESATMDMKDEMMGEAVDEAMDDEDEGVGEEEESDNILKESWMRLVFPWVSSWVRHRRQLCRRHKLRPSNVLQLGRGWWRIWWGRC